MVSTYSSLERHTFDSLSRDEYSAVSSQSMGTVGLPVEIFSRLYIIMAISTTLLPTEESKESGTVLCVATMIRVTI